MSSLSLRIPCSLFPQRYRNVLLASDAWHYFSVRNGFRLWSIVTIRRRISLEVPRMVEAYIA